MLFVGTIPCKEGSRYDHNKNVYAFMERHPEIEFTFLLHKEYFEHSMDDLDLTQNIVWCDLSREPMPPKQYDIVYVDTNTIGFINAALGDNQKDQIEWTEVFKTAVKPNGCLIIDDTDVYTRSASSPFIRTEVHAGMTRRIYHKQSIRFKNNALQDFCDNVLINSFAPLILIHADPGLKGPKLVQLKKTWDL